MPLWTSVLKTPGWRQYLDAVVKYFYYLYRLLVNNFEGKDVSNFLLKIYKIKKLDTLC